MATVTKLKAAVNNKNLPILGNDGKLYNYYIGRYKNKLQEFGYNLSETEENACTAFIEDGINNGWIETVGYILPFIGDRSHPRAGIVPLFDNVNDYVITDQTFDADIFAYDSNNKIKNLGKGASHERVLLGINSASFNSLNGNGYVNLSYVNGDENPGLGGNIIGVYTQNDDYFPFGISKGGANSNYLMVKIRTSEEQAEADSTLIHVSDVNTSLLPYNASLYYGKYVDEDGSNKYLRYFRGSNYPEGSFSGGSTGTMPYANGAISIGSDGRELKIAVNLIAIMFPNKVSQASIRSFDNAVQTLVAALGR